MGLFSIAYSETSPVALHDESLYTHVGETIDV